MMTRIWLFLEKYLVYVFLHLLGTTLQYHEHDPRPEKPCIHIFWHRNIIPLLYLHRHQNIAILISPSKDGELIAGPAELFGYKNIRGSSTKQGVAALHKFLKIAGNYNLAITPDGPKGPREHLKKSVLFIAYHTKLPLIPVAVDIDREWLFHTWDLFRVPKPKSRIHVSYGKPFYVKTKEELETTLPSLQFAMDSLQYKNREYVY